MAKVLIPFSSGINSTYALFKFLSETDHEVIATYAKESWVGHAQDPWRQSRETRSVEDKVNWLKSNVRDFTFETNTDWPVVTEDIRPVREGFTQTHDYGIVKARYEGFNNLIQAHDPDIFVHGLSLENTATDCDPVYKDLYWRDGVRVVYAGSRDLQPTSRDADYNTVAATFCGRFEQLESIPTALQDLTAPKCEVDHPPGMEWTCLIHGFELSRKALSHLSGREVDEIFAEYGKYGAYRSEADPETYKYRNNPQKKFAEILGVPDNVEVR